MRDLLILNVLNSTTWRIPPQIHSLLDGRLSIGAIYNGLDRLRRQGLIERREAVLTQEQRMKLDNRGGGCGEFRLTKAGLQRKLNTSPQPESNHHGEPTRPRQGTV